jgi:hypothetical protein
LGSFGFACEGACGSAWRAPVHTTDGASALQAAAPLIMTALSCRKLLLADRTSVAHQRNFFHGSD